MQVDERHHNPMGRLHSGIYCDLADAANQAQPPSTDHDCLLAKRFLQSFFFVLPHEKSFDGTPTVWPISRQVAFFFGRVKSGLSNSMPTQRRSDS
jgi:hypothetical protein